MTSGVVLWLAKDTYPFRKGSFALGQLCLLGLEPQGLKALNNGLSTPIVGLPVPVSVMARPTFGHWNVVAKQIVMTLW